MIRRFNRLILFVVLAAMSLRGMAAADLCTCAHDRRGASPSSTQQHLQQHAMHEEAAADEAGHPGHDAPSPANPADGFAHPGGSHCVSAAAAPVERIAFAFSPVGAGRIPYLEMRFVEFVPAQLERPPLLQSL